MTLESDLPNGPKLANYLDQWLRVQSTSRDVLEGKVEERFHTYLEDLRLNGLIGGVLVGSKPGERLGYIWNVFKEEYTLEKGIDPRYKRLNLLTIYFREDLEPFLPLRIAHLNPSMLEECRKGCEKLGIDTAYVEV